VPRTDVEKLKKCCISYQVRQNGRKILFIFLPSVDRFSTFFHWHSLRCRSIEKVCICDDWTGEQQANAADADTEPSLVIRHYCTKLRDKNKVTTLCAKHLQHYQLSLKNQLSDLDNFW